MISLDHKITLFIFLRCFKIVDLINGLEEEDVTKLQGETISGELSDKYETPTKFILNVNSWKG